MQRKRLFYTHAFSGGGAELVFARLSRAFAAGGDDIVFAADHVGGGVPPDMPGLRHLCLGPNHAIATARLAVLLRRERFDASFSALGGQNIKHLAAAAITGRLRRCVLGYHGFAEAEPRRLSRLSYRMSPLATRRAACTVCVSDALREDLIGRWGADQRRLVRIYNPIADFPPETSCGAAREPGLVVALGRLAPVKRFGDLVAAFARVAPETSRLVILGEGPERRTLEAAVARLGLSTRVSLPGHVDDPAPWFRAASCVAISSESESFGLTAAEALAHGTPVVTTACGGPPEVIGCGTGGRVVPVGDVAALAAALTAALADPDDPAPRRARAVALFSLAGIRDQYAALADSLG